MKIRKSVLIVLILAVLLPASAASKRRSTGVDEMQLPADYSIDLQLAVNSRSSMMHSAAEITGTADNQIGDEVFGNLVRAGFSQPYPWKLTLVNDAGVNASSNAGGQVYVYGGMPKLLTGNRGLWAAVLSHEVAHTGLRHHVRVYLQQVYQQRMITYYRARIYAGDKGANWALLGFSIAAPIALKKMEREQEHTADQTGMLLMARAGYHPDFVFALHHLLRLNTGEQSKFAAFFSDHPRWETRDQRSERVYAEAMTEYNRLWPNPELSPGGTPPPVAFLGQVTSAENKREHTADISIPLSCRHQADPVYVEVVFLNNGTPIKTGDGQGDVLHYEQRTQCPDADGVGAPTVLHLTAAELSPPERKLDAAIFVLGADRKPLEASKTVKVVFPKK